MTAWPIVPLSRVAEIERSSIQPSNIEAGTQFVGLEHVETGGRSINPKCVQNGEIASSKFRFSSEHLLYGKLRPYLAKIALPDFSGVCSTDIIPVKPGPDLDRRYLCYALRQPSMVDLATARAGGANLPRLSPTELAKLPIPLPPLPEQKRIAEILDATDALRAKRRESLAQLDAFLQSTFLHMFGDPVTNPMGWETDVLEKVCERVIDCPHSTPQWADSGVVCLRSSNLGFGEWNWADTRYVSESDFRERTKRSEIEADDIILSREGTVGVLARVEHGMRICMGQRLVQLRTLHLVVDPRYLLQLLLHDLAPARLSKFMAGSTSKHLNVKELRKMPISLPPLTLQHRFASIAKSVEQQKARLRSHLAELEALFASLQARAFNGEL